MWPSARTMPPGKITRAKPIGFELGRRQRRRLAALDHVGHQRQPWRRAPRRCGRGRRGSSAPRRTACRRRPRGTSAARSMARSKPSTATASVRAMISVSRERRASTAARILPHISPRRDQRLAVEMAAALGEVLVLELDRVGAGALELAHGAHDIERIAVAGVGIDDQVRSRRGRGSAPASRRPRSC